MIPRVIQQVWLGGKMPPDIARMRDRLIAMLEGLHQYHIWHDDNIAELGLRSDRLREEFGTWAAASNFVRLIALQRHGGIYLDSDFEALKPLAPLFDFGDCIAAEQDRGRICNAFMGATPNHPWINWQLANIARYDRKDAASGVYLATDAPRDGLTLVPQHLVYPYLYDAQPEKRVVHPDSLLVHLWHGSWTKPSA